MAVSASRTINSGAALPDIFTFTGSLGTSPYTYAFQVNQFGAGLTVAISGVDSNQVSFTGDAKAGATYPIEIKGTITDVKGDQYSEDAYYFVTVNPFVISMTPSPWSAGSFRASAISPTSVTLAAVSGGVAPYTYAFAWQGGIPPIAGMTIVQANSSDNIVELLAPAGAVVGNYSGTLVGTVTDSVPQVKQLSIDVTFSITLAPDAFAVQMVALNPHWWYRFSEANGNIINQGSGSPNADLVPTLFGNSFNATYAQAGTIPAETNGAMKFNAGGYLKADTTPIDRWSGAYGTVFMVLNTTGIGSTQWMWGSSSGFDTNAVIGRFVAGAGGIVYVHHIQNNQAGPDKSRIALVDIDDNSWHTICVRNNNDAEFPDIFIDGVIQTGNYSDGVGGTVPKNYWFGSFTSDTDSIGARAGVSSTPKFGGSVDEFAVFPDQALTNAEILDLHTATGI